MAAKIDDPELLLKVAWLYYVKDLTQEEIAKQVGLSRPTIIRLLKLAREQRIVEFRITRPLPRAFELGFQLEETFGPYGLQEAVVVSPSNGDSKGDVARAAALYVQRILLPDQILGVGWSTILGRMPAYFTPDKHSPSSIVQLVGSVGNVPGVDSFNSFEIAVRLAHMLNVPVHHIPAPAIVESPEIRNILLQDPLTRHALEMAGKCQVGLVGIGVTSANSTMIQTGTVRSDEVAGVAAQGGVGDILAYCYDIEGRAVRTPWQDRIMAISQQQLKEFDNLIGVAAGTKKASAVIGALRGSYLNTLVVDVPLAEAIMSQAGDGL